METGKGRVLETVLKTENLTHIYSVGTPFQKVAVKNINIEIKKGEFLGIIGHTGSGKSTLIQHLNGLLEPDSGTVYFKGRDINGTKEYKREVRFNVGLLFQYPEYQLFEDTVFRDIAFGPKNMGLSEGEVSERVHEAAKFVGLSEEDLEKPPFSLSGGQKRKTAIAGVIAMRPEVLILDEPTAGLDPGGRDSLIQNIRDYKDITNSTVIMVSHSMDEVAKNADRMLVMHDGGIVMEGTPREIFMRSDELSKIGLSIPEAAKIANRLIEMGIKIQPGIFTARQLASALRSLERGGRDA